MTTAREERNAKNVSESGEGRRCDLVGADDDGEQETIFSHMAPTHPDRIQILLLKTDTNSIQFYF